MKYLVFSLAFMFISIAGIAQIICTPVINRNIPSDEFPGCTICRTQIYGTTYSYTKDTTITYDFPCGEIENSQWFNVKTDDSGVLDIRFGPRNCSKGVEMGLYDKDLNLLGNCLQATTFVGEGIRRTNLPTDEFYYIMIDGIDGDNCEFYLQVNAGNQQTIFSPDLIRTPNRKICKGEEVTFSYETRTFVPSYNWEIPVDSVIIAGGEPLDSFVTLKSEEALSFDFKVNPGGVCNQPDQRLYNFSAVDNIYKSIGEKYYCREDRFNLPEDSCVIYPNGCDSCFNYTFRQYEDPGATIVQDTICKATCVMIGDSCYKETGTYTITFDEYYPNSCDSIVQLELVSLAVMPSPFIDYEVDSRGVRIYWEPERSTQYYEVFIDRDSFTTTTDTSIFITGLDIGEEIFVKIQPFGLCDNLPAEIIVTNFFTNTRNVNLDNNLLIIPNPTAGEITISTNLKVEQVEVYDTAGRFLQKEKTTSFELKNKETGIYFLKIKTNQGVGVKRVFKN